MKGFEGFRTTERDRRRVSAFLPTSCTARSTSPPAIATAT